MAFHGGYERRKNRYPKDDTGAEKVCADFLDRNFYTTIAKVNNLKFERIADRDLQIRGADVIFGRHYIDEKVKYKGVLNQVFQFPAFELSFLDRSTGELRDGWLVKDDNITDYYNIINVFCTGDEMDFGTIQKLRILFVKKSDICDYIEDDIITDEKYLRDEGHIYDLRKKYPHRKYWLTMSPNFVEQPINMVIPRDNILTFPNTVDYEVEANGQIHRMNKKVG